MRQLVLTSAPDAGGFVHLGEREWRYLAQVLRMSVGDSLDARCPDGALRPMTIQSFDRRAKTVTLRALDPSALAPVSQGREGTPVPGASMPAASAMLSGFPALILFQWILKGSRMDQVIRQATETGVRAIVPVAGERCLSPEAECVGGGKTGRWDRIVREALQQSGSPVPTAILPPIAPSGVKIVWQDLARQVSAAAGAPFALVLTEAPLARKSLHGYLCNATGPVAIAVGPEGGMTQAEITLLSEAGFSCVHFKTNILRAETAALYGIAAVQSVLLESENWRLNE
jgi:16S rRNA (uracil1498-N3)-methyltransferase